MITGDDRNQPAPGEAESDDLSKPTAPTRPARFPAFSSAGGLVAVAVVIGVAVIAYVVHVIAQRQMAIAAVRAGVAGAAAKAQQERMRAAAAGANQTDAPKGAAIADPVLREAREQFDGIMGELLAGKFDADPDLWPVARKLKGFQAWSIQSQRIAWEKAAEFKGVLTGADARSHFAVTVVKQASGKWAIGTFSGPYRGEAADRAGAK